MQLEVSKKTKKPRKPKKPNHEKNRLKFWKNQPVRFGFGFISLKRKKPSQTSKKLSQNWKKQVRPKKPSQTDLNQFLS
jgi:hypothetical protein